MRLLAHHAEYNTCIAITGVIVLSNEMNIDIFYRDIHIGKIKTVIAEQWYTHRKSEGIK